MLMISLAPRARDDIVAIAAYTLERWGDARMVRYVDDLHRRFALLSQFPETGRRRPDVGRRYRSVTQGSHVIFYRVTVKEVVIVRVLHGRMSAARHLPK
jgi:toxin ParE1/3/4